MINTYCIHHYTRVQVKAVQMFWTKQECKEHKT